MLFWLLAFVVSGSQLTGSVRSRDGVPIPNARVVAVEPAAPAVTTGATGAFDLAGIALPAVVEVSAPGFETRRVRIEEAPATITLAPAIVSESVIVNAEAGNVGMWRDPVAGRTTLRRTDIADIPAVTLDEALGVVSGFSLFRRSSSRYANPTTHGVTMRGLSASGASRGLVLLDGIPLNDGFGGWVTWTRLPAMAFTRVEVARGPHADVFGSDAVGGVVRIVTPVVSRTPRQDASVLVEAGSRGTGLVDGAAGYQAEGISLFGAASWFRTDGHIPIEPASRGGVDRRTDADWASGFGRAGVVRGGRRLTVTGWGGRDDRGNGTLLQRNTMSGGAVSAAFDAAGGDTTFAARVSHSPNTLDQSFTAVAGDRASEFLTNTQRIDASVTRMIAEVGRALPDGFIMVRGSMHRADADFGQVRPSSSSLDTVRDDAESVSVQASYAPSGALDRRLTLSGGIRSEWRAAPGEGDERDTAVVGQFGAAYRIDDALWVRGQVATSHRWPTLNELIRGFRVGNVVTDANPDLEPERSRSVEGAVVHDRGRVMVSVGAFRTRVENAIANVTVPAIPELIVRERQNAGDVRSTGLELDVEYRQGTRLRARGSLAVIDSTFADALEPGIAGNRVPQVPRVSGTFSVDAVLPRAVNATVVWRSTSAQFDDDRNVFELAAANQIDARVAVRFGRLEARVSLENLFDQRIEVGRTPLVTLAPGRAVRVGLRWSR
jgi:outer membrane cobalamin receptor